MYEGRSYEYFSSRGWPTSDDYALTPSPQLFPDGAQYRIEVPTVNSVAAMETLLQDTAKRGIHINRVSVTYGIMRYTDDEIQDMVALAGEYGSELFMMVGPRATLDIGAQAHIQSLNAQHIAYRLRGTDQLLFATEDALRGIDLGCRGLIASDEGLLTVLGEMRRDGAVPPEVKLKASILLGISNFMTLRHMEEAGADSANVQRDMPLSMIAGFRRASTLPLHLQANNPGQTGGFVRNYEVPKMIETAAPVYVKTGNVAVAAHGMMVDAAAGARMAREVEITVRHIERYFPEARQTPRGDGSLDLPASSNIREEKVAAGQA